MWQWLKTEPTTDKWCQEHDLMQLFREAKTKGRGRHTEDTTEEKLLSSPLLPAAELLRWPGAWEAASPLARSKLHFSHSCSDQWLSSSPALQALSFSHASIASVYPPSFCLPSSSPSRLDLDYLFK